MCNPGYELRRVVRVMRHSHNKSCENELKQTLCPLEKSYRRDDVFIAGIEQSSYEAFLV